MLNCYSIKTTIMKKIFLPLALCLVLAQSCKKDKHIEEDNLQTVAEYSNGNLSGRLSTPITALPAVYVAGIDVNKFRPLLQKDLDLNPNKIGFIFFRGINRTYLGNNNFSLATETNLVSQVQLARANGIPIGVYHRLLATPSAKLNPFTEAKFQAQKLIDAITAIGGLKPGDKAPIVDIERKPDEAASEMWNQLTPEPRMDFIITFNYTVEVKYGIKPIVYMQESFIPEFLKSTSILASVVDKITYNTQLATLGRSLLWEVNIDGYPEVIAPFTTASFSQISFGERVTNLRPVPLVDNVGEEKKDQDIFHGNYGSLINISYSASTLTYKRLDKGLVVAQLQTQLKKLGFYNGTIGVYKNAVFDLATENAVKQFQQARGITVTGIVNQQTWKSMYGI
jgi:GH25 family lysozyme M1 (1,4-beta-N-acetylmuramidase)